MNKIFTLLTLLILSQSNLFAQRLLTEDFNYAAGQLTKAAGGANVSGGKWDSISGNGHFIQVVNGSLTYSGYTSNPTSSSRKVSLLKTSESAEDVVSVFSAKSSNTVYMSFLVNLDSTAGLLADTSSKGDYFVSFLPSNSNSTYTGRVLIRQGSAANTYSLGIAAQSTNSVKAGWVAKNLTPGTTYLVTIAYQFVTGANNDVAKIWINHAKTSTEPAADATSTFTVGTEPTDVGKIALRQGGTTTPSCKIDAIKVSTSWSDGTLPVTLTSFNATLSNNKPVLTWTTANEVNMQGYVVERSSNGKDFSAIKEIAATGDTKTNSYSYTDVQTLQGAAWYRLKMVDKDGTITYSSTKLLSLKGIAALLLKENPVKNNLTITHSEAGENSFVKIVNANGTSVLNQKIGSGATQTTLNVSALSNGTYYIVFVNGNDKATAKFIKQ